MKNEKIVGCFHFQNTSNVQWFVNSDYCIGQISSKSIRLQPVFIQKRFEVNEKHTFSSEKMINSGNCISDYAHSFLGEDI